MRIERIIRETIEKLDLDLRGLIVFTEVASGYYMFTPIIATLAGAETIAFSKDSEYVKARDVSQDLMKWGERFNVDRMIRIVSQKKIEHIRRADIVTNSGLVRPIDRDFVRMMKLGAIVSLMFESWEVRDNDIDIKACKEKGIKIVGVNESHPLVDVFDYVGILGIKMLLEAGIEVYKSRIGVLSSDKFGVTLKRYLDKCGAEVILTADSKSLLKNSLLDAIIYADYNASIKIERDVIRLKESDTVIIQFLGGLDYNFLKSGGLLVYPDKAIPPKKMARTFSDLGPRPVIELQGAGLRASEIVYKGKLLDESDRFYGFAEEL
jgi:hypothetical protein